MLGPIDLTCTKLKFSLQYLKTMLLTTRKQYCEFGNFRENFIFAKVLKNDIAMLKTRDEGMIYYISNRQSDFAISRGFIFKIFCISEVSRI